MWPVGEEVWMSFCRRERDEKQMRMRSLTWRRRLSSERVVRRVERAARVGEGA